MGNIHNILEQMLHMTVLSHRFVVRLRKTQQNDAVKIYRGVEQLVARRAHIRLRRTLVQP